jgi:hypothetical protein
MCVDCVLASPRITQADSSRQTPPCGGSVTAGKLLRLTAHPRQTHPKDPDASSSSLALMLPTTMAGGRRTLETAGLGRDLTAAAASRWAPPSPHSSIGSGDHLVLVLFGLQEPTLITVNDHAPPPPQNATSRLQLHRLVDARPPRWAPVVFSLSGASEFYHRCFSDLPHHLPPTTRPTPALLRHMSCAWWQRSGRAPLCRIAWGTLADCGHGLGLLAKACLAFFGRHVELDSSPLDHGYGPEIGPRCCFPFYNFHFRYLISWNRFKFKNS